MLQVVNHVRARALMCLVAAMLFAVAPSLALAEGEESAVTELVDSAAWDGFFGDLVGGIAPIMLKVIGVGFGIAITFYIIKLVRKFVFKAS